MATASVFEPDAKFFTLLCSKEGGQPANQAALLMLDSIQGVLAKAHKKGFDGWHVASDLPHDIRSTCDMFIVG